MHHKVELKICEKTLSIEAGELAKQAGGSVVVRLGDTMVLVTATMAKSVREGIDFFPLTVDYREKTYAAGKIPGGFFKREGRPGDSETLICRLIDRPIRPLFPKGFMNETQIICTTMSHDLPDGRRSRFQIGSLRRLLLGSARSGQQHSHRQQQSTFNRVCHHENISRNPSANCNASRHNVHLACRLSSHSHGTVSSASCKNSLPPTGIPSCPLLPGASVDARSVARTCCGSSLFRMSGSLRVDRGY